MNLFKKDISSWEKWGKAFQDIEAFSLLIEHIFYKEGVPLLEIKNTSPGTNAVFECGNYIIKIYAPKETGIAESEYRGELEALNRARMQGVSCPTIFACGQVTDKYDFDYLICEKVLGSEARFVLPNYSYDEKNDFVQKLNGILQKINTIAPISDANQKSVPYSNNRWDIFAPQIKNHVIEIIDGMQFSEMVYVHGDLTGENVFINQNDLRIIDFGDARSAPIYYEYPPIVFELFNHNIDLIKLFAQGKDDFAENLFLATILHDYGAFFVRDICENKLNVNPMELKSINTIKQYILDLY